MSINWSASIGYGFIVDIDAIESTLGSYDDLCQDFDSVLELRYPLLEVGYAGDAFTGRGTERFVFIKDSIVDCRDWVMSFDIEKLNESMKGPGMDELWRFVNETSGAVGNLEWRLCIRCG